MSRTHAEIVARLQARWPENRVAPSRARVQALCDLLGSPERACPVILVAGTNGKGSTAAMIDSLLRALGLRVGRYASPHLVDLTERIIIDGEPIAAERFDELVEQTAPLVGLVAFTASNLRHPSPPRRRGPCCVALPSCRATDGRADSFAGHPPKEAA